MIRKFAICFAFLQFVLISFHPHSALGEFNCAFLDPRASVSQTKEGKIEASVDTLYKVAKAGGSIEGKVKNEIEIPYKK